jgi:hypothetical protein
MLTSIYLANNVSGSLKREGDNESKDNTSNSS